MLHKLDAYRDWALLLLRVAIAVIFIYHGSMKWPLSAESPVMMILAIAEPLGGIAMLLGILSRWAGLGLAIIMLGAIWNKMTGFGSSAFDFAGTFAGGGGTGWEFDLMILAGCVIVMAFGAGKMALGKSMRLE